MKAENRLTAFLKRWIECVLLRSLIKRAIFYKVISLYVFSSDFGQRKDDVFGHFIRFVEVIYILDVRSYITFMQLFGGTFNGFFISESRFHASTFVLCNIMSLQSVHFEVVLTVM